MLKMYFFLIMSILLFTGCGENSGSAGSSTTRVVLATHGALPTGGALSGIEVALQLPTGVTPTLTASGSVDNGVVKGSGVLGNSADLFAVTYTPASGAVPGSLNFVIYSTSLTGFGTGEFATVTLNKAARIVDFSTVSQNIEAGTPLPVNAGYSVASFSPRDLAGAVVNTITVSVSPGTI